MNTVLRRGASLLLLCLCMFSTAMARGDSMNLYVSPQGRDSWSGSQAAPNRSGTDGPFATLERARDAIRTLKKAEELSGGVTVWLRGGYYTLTQTFELTAEDTGRPEAPTVYRAYKKEEVHLLGGKEISGFAPVTETAILQRLSEAARSHVLQVNLKAHGITDFGKLTRRGFGQPIIPAGLELFFSDKPMTLARWPNGNTWAKIAGVPAGQDGGKFAYDGDRPARWTHADDVWLHGYWTYDWADTYERVKSIDVSKREIATAPPHGMYGYTAGKRYYAQNLLEELDEPGEWYLDRKSGILYFWPPAPLSQGKVFVSLLETPLITLNHVAYTTFRGLTLEASRGCGITITGGAHNLVAGCTLRNLGTFGVSIGDGGDYQDHIYKDPTWNRGGGTQNGVTGCDIYQTGEGAILLSGGDRKTLTPGGNFATNNHLWDYSRWAKTYRAGVMLDGVGNIVAHNRIHDAPHNAILLNGNEHRIEYNDIYRVCLETGDAGAFYLGRDFPQRGNIVRYNYFHDLRAGSIDGQQGFTEVMAVYLDDCACGTTVYGNIFYKAGRAILVGGGRDNTIENNIFVDCAPSIHVDARGTNWANSWFNGKDTTITDRLKFVQYDKPPYSTRYPKLAIVMQDDPAQPKGNIIARNIRVGGRWLDLMDGLNDKVVRIQNNLTEGDPEFVAPEKQDFRLKPGSPARKLGFKRIPVEKIGLVKDAYRSVLP